IRVLPGNPSHAEEIVCPNLERLGLVLGQKALHLLYCIRSAHRRRRIVTRYTAAVDRASGLGNSQMHRMPYQIVDEKSVTRHAQCFVSERNNLLRFQMVQEERTSHHIKAVICKWQGQRISTHGRMPTVEIAGRTVQQHRLEGDAVTSEKLG